MDNDNEGAVRADKLPRLLRIRQSLLNIERLGILEGIADEKWQKSLDTLKKVVQERSKE
jgi:hypothetical protein